VAAEPAREILARETGLYGIFDAAADDRVYDLVHAGEHASLYEGVKGEQLDRYAPFLVRFEPGSPALAPLLDAGWGKSWGIYLASRAPLRQVRKHFRQFLYVRTEERKRLYFRFYDPRVLRAFLPITTMRQASLLFRDVDAFLIEERRGEGLIRCSLGGSGVVAATQTF
jgi:hypothetical protein